jgi:hypothetical protein
LDSSAFREAAINPYLTGPALLISLLAAVLGTIGTAVTENFVSVIVRFAVFLLLVTLIYGAGRVLGSRASFTDNFRAVGFAQSAVLLSVLALIQPLAPVIGVIVTVLTLIGTWMAAVEANRTSGWKTLIFPIVIIFVVIAGAVVVSLLLGGLSLTVESLQGAFGLTK